VYNNNKKHDVQNRAKVIKRSISDLRRCDTWRELAQSSARFVEVPISWSEGLHMSFVKQDSRKYALQNKWTEIKSVTVQNVQRMFTITVKWRSRM